MPEEQGYTYEEMLKMGAKPAALEIGKPTAPETLMESSRAASTDEFNANQPKRTIYTGGREYALGAAEGFGINPSSSVIENAKNIGSGLLNAGKAFVTDPLTGRGTARAQEMLGGVGRILVQGPQEIAQGWNEGDSDKAAHGAGMTTTATLPAIYGATKGLATAGSELVGKTRRVLAGMGKDIPQEQAWVEHLIGAKGKEAEKLTAQISPTLSQDPQLVGMAKQALADRYNVAKFRKASNQLNVADASVPADTTVLREPILQELDAGIEELRVPAEPLTQEVPISTPGRGITGFTNETTPQFISGHGDALKVLIEARNEIAKFPEQIPFKDLRKYRQQLDQSIQTHSGWKETANAADQAAMQAKRKVVNSVRRQLSGISKEMDAANKAYSEAADTLSASGVDFETGRRLSTVSKPSELAKKTKRVLGKIGLTAAAGAGAGAGYKAWSE